MNSLYSVLVACITGGVSDDTVYAKFPFSKEGEAVVGRKPSGFQSIGTVQEIQDTAVSLYGGIVPPESAGEIAQYIIAEILVEMEDENYCEACAYYGGACGNCSGSYWIANSYAK